MRLRKQVLIDAETGELIQKGAKFFMVYCATNFTLDRRLSLTEIRVLGYLANRMNRDGYVIETQAFIADRLQILKPNLSRALKHLRELDYVIPGTYQGRKVIRVNPEFISKRKNSDWRNELEALREDDR